MVRTVLLAAAAVCFLLCAAWSLHWHIVQDAACMHDVAFLMDHGVAPYRQIVDINGPGAYMSEWLVMHTFGPGSLAWRLYDDTLMLAITGLLAWLTASRDWMAGAFAGLALGCCHIANGPNELGERGWTILLLMLIGYAALFYAMRRGRALPMLLFGLSFGAAVSIKPLVAPIPFLLLAIACVVLHRGGVALSRSIAFAFLGALPPLLAFVTFLYLWHVYPAFYAIFHELVPFYVGFGNPPFQDLLWTGLGHVVTGLTVLACLLYAWQSKSRDVESLLLGLGIVFGFILYLAQRKGFIYHRATLYAFALVWIALQGYTALSSRRPWRWLGVVVLLLLLARTAFYWVPMARVARVDESRVVLLEGQLNALGGQTLNRDVQCVDMVQGCINALYNLRLQESTGFMEDFFLFRPNRLPVFDRLRAQFLTDLARRPPKVLIVAPYVWEVNVPNYAELENWPAFGAFVHAHYRQIAEERGPHGDVDYFSYRLYILREESPAAAGQRETARPAAAPEAQAH